MSPNASGPRDEPADDRAADDRAADDRAADDRAADTAGAGGDASADGASDMRRHSSLVAAGIAVSRVSGLVRDAVLAFFLGANLGADAFRAALKIPNLLQNLLGEGVLSASFIPTYSRLLADGRARDAGRVAGATLGLLTVLTGVLVLGGVLLARPLTLVLAPGFTGERFELTVTLVRIMFPGIGVLVLSAWCLGVLNAHRRFFLSYVAPVMWNLGILIVLFTATGLGMLPATIAAGWGVVLGGLLQVAVQVPTVRRVLRGTLRPSLDHRDRHVRQVLGAFGTVVAGRGVVQVAALVDLVIASFLAVGAVAAIGYAQTFYLLPIALFGMSVAAAELPSLSTMGVADPRVVTTRLEAGLARTGFFVTGVVVAYLVVGAEVIEVLFGRGAFDAATTIQVALVLAVYSLGLLPAASARLLQSQLYAMDDARRAAIVAVQRVLVAAVIAVPSMLVFDRLVVDLDATWLVGIADGAQLFAWDAVEPALREAGSNQLRLGALGLAAGSAVGAWLEYALLRRALTRREVTPRLGGGTLGRLLVAAVVAAGTAILAHLLLPSGAGALLRLVVAGGLAGAGYLATARMIGVAEARQLVERAVQAVRAIVSRRLSR